MAKLTGKTIVFTGKLEMMTRDEAAAQAKALGAKVGSAITKETDILVAGPGAGYKLTDAKKHGVQVIDEAAWVKIAKRGKGTKNAIEKSGSTKSAKSPQKTTDDMRGVASVKMATKKEEIMSEFRDKRFFFHGAFSFFSNEQRDEALNAHGAKLITSVEPDAELDFVVLGSLGSNKNKLSRDRIGDAEILDEMGFCRKIIFTKPVLKVAVDSVGKHQENEELLTKNHFDKKEGQELLDALEEVFQLSDAWEDKFGWFNLEDQIAYEEVDKRSPVKRSWCQIKEHKNVWAIEIVTGGKSRRGGGWFSDDLEINSFELNFKWRDKAGNWCGSKGSRGASQEQKTANRKFTDWLAKDLEIAALLVDAGYARTLFKEKK